MSIKYIKEEKVICKCTQSKVYSINYSDALIRDIADVPIAN